MEGIESTMTIANIMLTIIALAVATSAVTAVLLFTRIKRTLSAAEQSLHRLSELTPRVARVLDDASAELVALKALTQRTQAVTEKVHGITANVQGISEELRQGAQFFNLARRSRALWAGARAGLSSLRRVTHHNGYGEEGDDHE
jgi:uncharacterized protein YoxC